MPFTTQAYHLLLQNVLMNITPALPSGAPGTRPPVGSPETIPDVTFITRTLTAADGFPQTERDRLNGYITGAIAYHRLYNLAPILIDSFEDILTHFHGAPGPIGRIRIVSHGSDAFLFMPMFEGGAWDLGIQADHLEAFQTSDEKGLRFMIAHDKDASPTLIDSTTEIVTGIRAHNSAVLAPFGLAASGSPPAGDQKLYFDVINDLYQVKEGSVFTQGFPPPPNPALLTAAQQATLTAALNMIESAIRRRLVGVKIGTVTLTDAHMTALRDAVLAATPAEMGFFGPVKNLGATVLADLAAAMAANPRVEDDLRNAIAGSLGEPMFANLSGNIGTALEIFNTTALTLGGNKRDMAFIGANPDLLNFFFICNDLLVLKHGRIQIAGTPITAAQRTTLRNGLLAMAGLISPRVTSGGLGINAAQLTRLRTGIEALTTRHALTDSTQGLDLRSIRDLGAANRALTVTAGNVGFRAKINSLRGIMRSTSAVDIRGCLIGATPSFLTNLRDFLGTGANRPTVSAPDWFQSFPSSIQFQAGPTIFGHINTVVNNGIPPDVTSLDVGSALTDWRALIDFDAHFDFFNNLFAAPNQLLDFAALEWRLFQTGGAGSGIPILRMQAARVDDLPAQNLGNVIERFRAIFEVAAGSAPNAAARGRLTQLQPHLVTFKRLRDAVGAISNPADPSLPTIQTQLNTLAGQITGIGGFPTPAKPLPPASASLADIQTSVTNFTAHIDRLLTANLNPFFAAMQARFGHANASIRYFYNIGLPLLLQSSATPAHFHVSTFVSAGTTAQNLTLVAGALRSWMKIQWTGTAIQSAAMNAHIDGLAIGNTAQRLAASQVSMLSELDPLANPASDAAINPMPKFRTHIITRP